MKFTLSWLKEHLETSACLQEITDKLTAIGLEVESITDRAKDLAPFIVAEILEARQHPDADKLRVCTVDNGKEKLQIVCGAANARAGIKVVLAPVGAVIPANGLKIKASKIRGVESNGMLCSAGELAIGGDGGGIVELPPDAEIGKSFVSQMGLDDPVIEINITPNRGDCLGVYGVARDLAAAGVGRFKEKKVSHVKGQFVSPVKVGLDNKEKCPYYVGRYIRNVKNVESPDWLKLRLESIGLRPISALVDITNFLTFDLGRPAHVYDVQKLKGDLAVRDSAKGEKLKALDNKEYELPAGITVIADDAGPVAIGGIIGGEFTGCSPDTTDVLLEIAYFDPVSVAKDGRKLQINTDSRYRFERGVDPAFLKNAAEIATGLILGICGGEASEIIVAGTEPDWKKMVNLRYKKIEELTGISISQEKIESILQNLGFDSSRSSGSIAVNIPSWREDIEIEADLIEEIARINGYENLPSLGLPRPSGKVDTLTPSRRASFDIRNILSSLGMKEVVTFSFTNSSYAALFGGGKVKLENPISSDLDAMRPSILPNFLEALRKNQARGYADLALFEVGPVFIDSKPGAQKLVASGIRSGTTHPKNHYGESREVDVFDAKADALAALSPYISGDNLTITRDAPSYYHPGRAGALVLGKKVLSYFGELHPSVLKKMDVKGRVVGFEVYIEDAPQPRLKGHAKAKLLINNFQHVDRDFAFIIDSSTPASELIKTVRKVDNNLIEKVSIFDVYSGKGIEEGRKSIAINVRLQPRDRTLTDQEIEVISSKIIENVKSSLGAKLR